MSQNISEGTYQARPGVTKSELADIVGEVYFPFELEMRGLTIIVPEGVEVPPEVSVRELCPQIRERYGPTVRLGDYVQL